jgi:hypothetical protein
MDENDAPGTPAAPWVRYINGRGPDSDPRRCNNSLDCSLSGLATWFGRPTVSAPRTAHQMPDGRVERGGEARARDRAEARIGRPYTYIGRGARAYAVIARTLRSSGHGAAAAIVTEWPGVGAHAWNALCADPDVTWVDFQNGRMSEEPLYTDETARVFVICVNGKGGPIDVH